MLKSIAVMRRLWTGAPVEFAGEHFTLQGEVASPTPYQQHLPVYIGGNRRPALRRVAAHGDGWHPLGPSPEGLTTRLATLTTELERRGRSLSDIEVSVRLDVGRARQSSAELVDLLGSYVTAGATEIVVSISSGSEVEPATSSSCGA